VVGALVLAFELVLDVAPAWLSAAGLALGRWTGRGGFAA